MSSIAARWNSLNERLKDFPKFQNKEHPGVSEEQIKSFESKWKIKLPDDIRQAIRIHNGRPHISYGLHFRSPTTDLLPIDEWKPYEQSEDAFADDLFSSLADEKDQCADRHLREDVQEHLKIYREEKEKNASEDLKLSANERFQSTPSELLVIGQGMDDYAEQYLLSVRSGRIYLAVHNIPEWRLIGSFAQWIETALSTIEEQSDEIKEVHDDLKNE